MLNIGYNHQVVIDQIIAIVASDSAPIKRLIHRAKDAGKLFDCTKGKRTRSAVVTMDEDVYLSAFTADSLANRMESAYHLSKVVNDQSNWIHPFYR
ncbi:DUF370 domain-containing protein [bacterium (Candidatus Blackallbacteria) CG17_big_fil_post_rev_8_21_14_2_50_48_46]|uniref:DUF370 domain-containing protein n=1 Tax=bacterium (Candidatus Blackallbacteria) CG17_big_fil_post_rev_8_21_14_2_50_48_46 TaxID=2014261 RepID=A0A2M7FWZ6_9BACT|nr:MAG: hypothetical protein COW64_18930 [bacterium (Candidatus Blackallbacteria) CG18_big_fil_WC_8_21_14_2_50_49_26]PIW13734.1 MAG: DUF370 domain-containing protein [bacterium (Candidatus Blackallbacteria) CG17_big_fil_post_rev_8_21_14_2_50_48_46]PIW44960.1 MAG: DUF370 domain-containing protein [bacterium (Candidatus Blackallbacteria) CG13_big_fil_rev_8_21_14_2_50_49_14]